MRMRRSIQTALKATCTILSVGLRILCSAPAFALEGKYKIVMKRCCHFKMGGPPGSRGLIDVIGMNHHYNFLYPTEMVLSSH